MFAVTCLRVFEQFKVDWISVSPRHRPWSPSWGLLVARPGAPWRGTGLSGWTAGQGCCRAPSDETKEPVCTAWDWPQQTVHTALWRTLLHSGREQKCTVLWIIIMHYCFAASLRHFKLWQCYIYHDMALYSKCTFVMHSYLIYNYAVAQWAWHSTAKPAFDSRSELFAEHSPSLSSVSL